MLFGEMFSFPFRLPCDNASMVKRVYLGRLTSLRFFAALVVVLNHITFTMAPIKGVSSLMGVGTVGVGFFFALSGFILTWSRRPADTAAEFYRRRFARIYPLHFATFLIAVPVLLFVGIGFSLPEAIANVFVVQSWLPDSNVYFGMNTPSWSLSCEAFFYLLFPFVIPFIQRVKAKWAGIFCLVTVLANLLIAVVVTHLSTVTTHIAGGGEPARFFLYVFPPYRMIGFLAGCLLAHWMSHGVRFRQPTLFAIVLAGSAYLAIFEAQKLIGGFGYGVEDALFLPFLLYLIAAAVTADLANKPGPLQSRPLLRLGEWSFALYLTHWLLMTVVQRMFPELHDATLAIRITADIAFIVVAIGISALTYYCVERPLEKRLRGAPPRPEMSVVETVALPRGRRIPL
ncbi:MAG TPA: acyltransferase [Lacisediminihabitans sp.]|uniref:acyltransferase family protein n=1 Tax=Lacisediminihabitans sp. TaxID=2787631 RepID=UPI002ED7DAF4